MHDPDGRLLAQALSVFDDPGDAVLAFDRAASFRETAAFPHLALRDFLPVELAQAAREQFPGLDDIPWYTAAHDNAHKRYLFEDRCLLSLHRMVTAAFSSSRLLLFLEELTCISNLVPDPHMVGGGMHLMETGGLLQVHADFNWYHKLQLHRRVNVLWYLCDDWDEAWGGALEFWDPATKTPVDRASSHFNSLAVFATGAGSLHGQPDALACPEGVYRRALNFHYYTSAPLPEEKDDPHWTRYVTGSGGDTNTVPAQDPYAVDASPFAAGLRERLRAGADTQTV